MAKYFASPFGTIIGKVNGQVGSRWRGLNLIKKFTVPTDKGTILKYQQMKDGIIPPDRFSFPIFNLRRAVVNALMHMGRENPDFLTDIWKPEVKSRALNMSGLNLFCKENITQLYASLDKTLEFYSAEENQIPVEVLPTNTIDITQMVVAEGILEGTSLLSATYDTATGYVELTWSPTCLKDGLATDIAAACVIQKPVFESIGRNGNWQPALKLWYFPTFPRSPLPPGPAKTRTDGSGTLAIATGLDAANLTAFIFFFQQGSIKTLVSISLSTVVTTPP
jgi:hypothetical protein